MMKIIAPRAWVEDLQMDFDVWSDYSGRGMGARTCFAIVGTNKELAKFLIYELPTFYETDPRVPEEWTQLEMDAMGTGVIYYWPGITVESDLTAPSCEWWCRLPGAFPGEMRKQ